jgi:hypothetical protein
MQRQTRSGIPFWYWAVAAAALLWNQMGCVMFGIEMFAQETAMESMTQEQKAWVRSIPRWIYVVYGVAVSSGVAGSIGLFMRKNWSIAMFAVCLVAVSVQMIFTMILGGGLQVMGRSGLIMPALVIGIAAILLWFSWFAKNRGWFVPMIPAVKPE